MSDNKKILVRVRYPATSGVNADFWVKKFRETKRGLKLNPRFEFWKKQADRTGIVRIMKEVKINR